nr:uncharacterized protein LOC115255174 [Aedes albopictus]
MERSLHTAMRNLDCVEKRLQRQGLTEQYRNIVESYHEKGYVVKVPWRQVDWSNASKARVTPLKETTSTTPKLELTAAVLGTRLCETVIKEYRLPEASLHFWTDSTTVLCWLNSKKRLIPFVAARVSEILSKTSSTNWRYIPSSSNPSDFATRDGSISTDKLRVWVAGPNFLAQSEDDWPIELKCYNVSPTDGFLATTIEDTDGGGNYDLSKGLPDPERFSNLSRLIRSTAWMIRFVRNSSKQHDRLGGPLTAKEVSYATTLWIHSVQQHAFGDELKMLRANKPVQDKLLTQLDPYVSDGIMQVGGRLRNAECLDDNAKHPIILDRHHRFVKLLIEDYHKRANHFGLDLVLNQIKEKYYFSKMRATVKTVIHNCQSRVKWKVAKENMKVGDVVKMADPKVPRGDWPLGRVVKVYTGDDGLVRYADVRTQNTTLRRPVTKLAVIEGLD